MTCNETSNNQWKGNKEKKVWDNSGIDSCESEESESQREHSL